MQVSGALRSRSPTARVWRARRKAAAETRQRRRRPPESLPARFISLIERLAAQWRPPARGNPSPPGKTPAGPPRPGSPRFLANQKKLLLSAHVRLRPRALAIQHRARTGVLAARQQPRSRSGALELSRRRRDRKWNFVTGLAHPVERALEKSYRRLVILSRAACRVPRSALTSPRGIGLGSRRTAKVLDRLAFTAGLAKEPARSCSVSRIFASKLQRAQEVFRLAVLPRSMLMRPSRPRQSAYPDRAAAHAALLRTPTLN